MGEKGNALPEERGKGIQRVAILFLFSSILSVLLKVDGWMSFIVWVLGLIEFLVDTIAPHRHPPAVEIIMVFYAFPIYFEDFFSHG